MKCQVLRPKLITIPASLKTIIICEDFARISSDMKLTRATSTPQKVDAFGHSDVPVDLQRVVAFCDRPDDGFGSSEEILESETLGEP